MAAPPLYLIITFFNVKVIIESRICVLYFIKKVLQLLLFKADSWYMPLLILIDLKKKKKSAEVQTEVTGN